jgi:hypothetical protein
MKRAAYAVLLVVAAFLLLLASSPSGAHGWRGHRVHGHGWHGHRYHAARVYVGLGSAFWWVAGRAWYGPPVVYTTSQRVIVEEPPVYIQREPASALPASYWYYCQSKGAYYPSVATCPEPWVRVQPRTP